MATHASGDVRGVLRTTRGVPRPNYDVAKRCRTTGVSILLLLVVIVLLTLI